MSEHVHRAARLDDAIRALVRVVREDQAGDTSTNVCLGDLIREEREGLGLSVRDLSARSGVDKAMISRIENHINLDPRTSELSRLAEALSLFPAKLFDAALTSRRILAPSTDRRGG